MNFLYSFLFGIGCGSLMFAFVGLCEIMINLFAKKEDGRRTGEFNLMRLTVYSLFCAVGFWFISLKW